ncbi:MAG: PAS domain S-box protein [Hydrogenophaga sp.]|nr:PAS domain S-box protein [Hydrogenophaga sp.]
MTTTQTDATGWRDDPMDAQDTPTLAAHQRDALNALLGTVSVGAPLVSLALWFRDGMAPILLVVLGLTAFLWLTWLLFHRGFVRLAAHLFVGSLVLGSTAGMLVDGSVRSAAVLVLMAALVMAGTFLPRRATIVTGVYCALALGAIIRLEQLGHIGGRPLQLGLAVWIVQIVVIFTILASVFYTRFRMTDAFRRLEAALGRARAVETDLRASEERFMVLFRNNPAACLVQRVGTQEVVDANLAFVKLFGYSREELIGRPPPTFWTHGHEHLAFRAALKVHGRVNGLRATTCCHDGRLLDVMIYANVVTQQDERLLLVMVLDITAEQASRTALEQSEERFSKAFLSSPIGAVISRISDGTYLEVNPANERVLGYSQEDLLGRTAREVEVWLSETEHERYTSQLMEQGQVLNFSTRLRSKQGEAVDVTLWSQTIDLNGERCALAYTINVTEQRRREAMLMTVARSVATHTGEAYFLSAAEHLASAIAADGIVIAEITSDQQLDTLALLHHGELQPNRRVGLLHTAYARLLLQDDLLLIDTRARQIVQHAPPFDPDDMQAFAGVTLRDADGSPAGVIAVTWRLMPDYNDDLHALLTIFASRCNAELLRLRRDREIRQLHASLEQRVAERTAQLEYLNRELDSFAYSVSHDLKSPLRSIDGFMHVLQEQLAARLTPEDEDLIERINGSVSRMNGLITDLLALARVSQGRLQRMQVNLTELAEDVVRRESQRDPERQVEVRITADMMADCDARMAQIVLENLLGNAWKYTRLQPQPVIELGQLPGAGGAPPTFFVRDNGAGFDMKRSDRLFKPFNRLHAASEFEGSGIGLATVRRIIERHGGRIQGQGAVGQGARFEFSFGSGEPG